MESLFGQLEHKGQTLSTAPSLRLQNKPVHKNPKAFEDLGTSFGRQDSPKKPKFKPAGSQSTRRGASSTQGPPPASRNSRKVIETEDDISNDEMDLLSHDGNDESDHGFYRHTDGTEHAWDAKYHPSQSKTLAGLKFKKKKPVENKGPPPSPTKSPTKAKENGYTSTHSSSGNIKGIGRSYATESRVSSSRPKVKAPRYVDISDDDEEIKVSSPLKTSNRSVTPPRQGTSTSKPENDTAVPKPRPKPRPRPIAKAQSSTNASQPSQPKSQPWAVGSLSMELIPLGSRKGKEKETPLLDEVHEPHKPIPEPFPTISPPSSPAKPKVPAAFPNMSPLASSKTPQQIGSKKVSAFPLSPLRSDDARKVSVGSGSAVQVTVKKPKGGKEQVGAPKAGKKKAQSKLEAFPMSTQVLASIGSPRLSDSSPMSGKRTSEDGNDDGHRAKKRREHQSLMESPTRHFFEDEGDSISINPNVDPKTLCPYCDTPLPESPTPLLVKLLATTAKKSRRDPRPANPLGLKAPLAIFIAACQRHRFESQILPEAERKGWPKTIKWKKVARRVQAMSDDLEALIQDPGVDLDSESDDHELDDLFGDEKGPKARSIFWQEIVAEVKKKGSRAVAGVRGQFANFEKTQPGYYGELGSVIIHQTLFNMFPPASFNSAFVSPLSMNEFVSRILVPEVASRLIMEDKDLEGEEGMAQAVKILRESSAYGVAMFPEDGGEWGGSKKRDDDTTMGVGDLIVMERARKRRKELEEEDEREEEERRLAEDEAKAKAKKKKKKESTSQRKGKQKEQDDDMTSDATDSVARSRPRPRPLAKTTSSMSFDIDSDTMVVSMKPRSRDSSTSRRGAYRSDADTEPAEDSPIELSESDASHKPMSRRKWRRSPSASESWQRIPSSKPPSSNSTTGRVLSELNIETDLEFPPSDSSTRAVVNPARPIPRKTTSRKLEKMDVDENDDDIEFVDTSVTKTPLAKQGASRRLEDEATPKASHNEPTPGHTPILHRARRRKRPEQQGEGEDGWSKSMLDRSNSGSYNWLLSDVSQSSLANADDNRSRR